MGKYTVEVEYAVSFRKELTIYAPTEQEAEDKANGIVSRWKQAAPHHVLIGVEDVTVIDIQRDEE